MCTPNPGSLLEDEAISSTKLILHLRQLIRLGDALPPHRMYVSIGV